MYVSSVYGYVCQFVLHCRSGKLFGNHWNKNKETLASFFCSLEINYMIIWLCYSKEKDQDCKGNLCH